MAMFPSGYFIRSPFVKYQRVAIVSGPKRPIYIMTIDVSLLAVQSPVVIPVVSPTVPNALVISNKASLIAISGSKAQSINVPTAITLIPMTAMTDALRNTPRGTE